MGRPAKASIDLNALRANYRLAQEVAPHSQSLAVVKANAYGHGAVACARALESLAPAFGVACIEEALKLRAAGISKPILLLEGSFTADEVAIAARENFWLMVENEQHIEQIRASHPDHPVQVWIKVDTGMHRLGMEPAQLPAVYETLKGLPQVMDEMVIATHFSSADSLDDPTTRLQIKTFSRACEGLEAPRSLANSAGLMAWADARAQWNRPGFMLYGASPFDRPQAVADRLRPVMTLSSGVIGLRQVAAGEAVGYARSWVAQRPSTIATVAIGYGDGYPRHAPSGTPVLVNGQRAPLVGRVSMDMITVDVTDLPPVSLNDPVVLWGAELPVNEIAACAGTIGYELLTRMTGRVPLSYRGGDE
ncbi:alanine racemase [Aestuariirhabdus litorea]|uniref:Alanine racemase n=1 Tax=Aestuariirhabdus litorea TaxID=2528527 RepID=A0A3P3VK02_9GAMM|nr:alanine racemase [Aestuariirhabdus litorea]RRJ83061.1 alanine racemase [Aestuariirhabdus litorea]RWW93219.1 alanine racemase [Endozoicomonadaceae bacterium GTF-13]